MSKQKNNLNQEVYDFTIPHENVIETDSVPVIEIENENSSEELQVFKTPNMEDIGNNYQFFLYSTLLDKESHFPNFENIVNESDGHEIDISAEYVPFLDNIEEMISFMDTKDNTVNSRSASKMLEDNLILCINCLKYVGSFNNDPFFKSFCDCCYEKLFKQGIKNLCTAMNRCSTCVHSLRNSVAKVNHSCARSDIHCCFGCHRVYKHKDKLAEHLKSGKCKSIKIISPKSSELHYAKVDYNSGEGVDNAQPSTSSSVFQVSDLGKKASDSKVKSGCKPFKCAYCEKSFVYEKSLICHERTHTGVRPIRCKHCEKTFVRSCDLTIHERFHLGLKPYKCDKRFTESSKVKICEKIHAGEMKARKEFKCSQCEKIFAQKKNLVFHESSHTGIKPYNCNFCEKRFVRPGGLKVHEMLHLGIKPYKCNDCGKCFAQTNKLKLHEKSHSGDLPYICNHCDKPFLTLTRLKRHQVTHMVNKPYKCNVCDKSFSQPATLSRHERLHFGIKPYKCHTCEKFFNSSCDLNRHEKLHTDDRQFKCDICEKAFVDKVILKRHHKLHTIQGRPFVCNIDSCGKSFKVIYDLRKHERTHSDEKPHSCDICGKTFRELRYVRRHEKNHSNIRPFKCDLCEKAFIYKSELTTHKIVHSKMTFIKLFKCNVCEMVFSDFNSHKIHRESHFGV